MFKKLKVSWSKWLEAIAKQNNQSFGSGKLDCCDLNRPKK